jgi:sarcosine oxidase subunit gamma
LWLGPRSWLWLAHSVAGDFDSARDALNAAGAALFDVSAGYVMWHASGRHVARVLNRMCPLDLHDSSFGPGHCAQSVLGHITGIVYRPSAAPAFVLLVARSYARDAWDHLCASAAPEGLITLPPITLGAAHA